MTDEDVYPIWLRKLTAKLVSPVPGSPWPPRKRLKICGDCNARLNRSVEIPCKPVITRLVRGDRSPLSREEQEKAALWMIKTSLLILLARQAETDTSGRTPAGRHRDGLRRVLLRMINTGRPPRFAGLRAGYLQPEDADAVLRPFLVDPLLVHHNALSGIVWTGNVMWEAVILLGGEVRTDVLNVGSDARLTRLWPIDDSVSNEWPPAQPVGERSLRALRQAWAHEPEVLAQQEWVVDSDAGRDLGGQPA